jgi:hypothetical protein
MKKNILICILLFNLVCIAQVDKTVTLSVSGTGKTIEEAKNNALRSAIEQAFGAFISSKTDILNDNLVKDEIVSVANGNIQKFEIISEVEIPNIGYAISLKATVSINKLTSFVESKGVKVEFKGSLFAFNVNQQILNEKNEVKAIEDLCEILTTLSDLSFNYTIKVSDPIAVNSSNLQWKIPMFVSVAPNDNFTNFTNYINNTLKGLSLSSDDTNNYINLGKLVYPISIAINNSEYNYVVLRTEKSIKELITQLYYFNHSLLNFKISNGVSEFRGNSDEKIINIEDDAFRIFTKQANNGIDRSAYCPASVFYSGSCRKKGDLILNYSDWDTSIAKFQTGFTINRLNNEGMESKVYFVNQFEFVKQLEDQMFEGTWEQTGALGKFDASGKQSGLIISFIGIEPNKEVAKFYYNDIKTLDEINKISEYTVSPIGILGLINY